MYYKIWPLLLKSITILFLWESIIYYKCLLPRDFKYTFFPLVILTKQVWHYKQIPSDSDVRKWLNKMNEKKK